MRTNNINNKKQRVDSRNLGNRQDYFGEFIVTIRGSIDWLIGGNVKMIITIPVDVDAVRDELVVEELVRREDGDDGDDEVHELAAEESEGVHVELVVDVLLELPQHPTHLLLGIVHDATRRTWNS